MCHKVNSPVNYLNLFTRPQEKKNAIKEIRCSFFAMARHFKTLFKTLNGIINGIYRYSVDHFRGFSLIKITSQC